MMRWTKAARERWVAQGSDRNPIPVVVAARLGILILLMLATTAEAQERPRGLKGGTYVWSLEDGGRTRTYRIHIPPAYDPAQGAALVLAFHGGTGSGRGMEILSGLSPISDREGFIVAYPDGIGRTWNDGRGLERFPAMSQGIDDVGFVSRLIDELVTRLSIDRSRVYATGISNGGHFVHRLGLDLSDKIAAIAPVAATVARSLAESGRRPGYPVAVIDFHGDEDRFNYWDGGGRAGGDTLSVPALIQWWVKHNACSTNAETRILPDIADDGTKVESQIYRGGLQGVEVILYTIKGGGHTWPGGYQYLPEARIGRTSRDIHASELMWEFFSRYRREMPANRQVAPPEGSDP